MAFRTAELEALCNSGKHMQQLLGDQVASRVQMLFFLLDAANSLSSLPTSSPILRNQIAESDPPIFSVGRAGRGQVLFEPSTQPCPQAIEDISEVRILKIGGSVL